MSGGSKFDRGGRVPTMLGGFVDRSGLETLRITMTANGSLRTRMRKVGRIVQTRKIMIKCT